MKIITFNQLGRYGRLGNQMFQIASTIGIARKNGFNYAFPYWRNYDHLERFATREDIDVQCYFVHKLPKYEGPRLREFFVHWGYHDIKVDTNISLSGHMQSERFFSHCEDEIRYVFEPSEKLPQTDYCAVHIRLGDYDGNYHPILDLDYYLPAMNAMPEGTKFLIFSDEPEKAKRLFGRNVIAEYSEGNNYMHDFNIMRSCKHFIIGNSTFSWWAAWLGTHPEKKVIAPTKWFGSIANLSSNDIYCKGWTKL